MVREYKFDADQVGDVDLDQEVVLDGKGRRITEARADEMAQEALARVGRPSLSAGGSTSPEVKARVPAQLKERVEQLARDRQTTTSTVIREALEEYLAHH
ncbi:ribbon-helix-helix protein, CopG family [Actinosynnema sp. NPDC091369]